MKAENTGLSTRRRLSEARTLRAKRFYEWDASKDRAWLRAYDKYLDRLAGNLTQDEDDEIKDKYDRVWVYGCTRDIPLVVFENGKKYLASYEYETAGKIDARSKEIFRITDIFELIAFNLYEFPEDDTIPTRWDKKKTAKVATIFKDFTDDIDRLDGITVADGTPVVEALEDQAIKGVVKAYKDGDVDEYYPYDYDPEYDDAELEVELVYKGELNKRSDKDMRERNHKRSYRF